VALPGKTYCMPKAHAAIGCTPKPVSSAAVEDTRQMPLVQKMNGVTIAVNCLDWGYESGNRVT
jgi:hypothetical protein